MFTKEEAQILADLIDKTPIQGNLQTLPIVLEKFAKIRVKLQALIEAEKEKEIVKP